MDVSPGFGCAARRSPGRASGLPSLQLRTSTKPSDPACKARAARASSDRYWQQKRLAGKVGKDPSPVDFRTCGFQIRLLRSYDTLFWVNHLSTCRLKCIFHFSWVKTDVYRTAPKILYHFYFSYVGLKIRLEISIN